MMGEWENDDKMRPILSKMDEIIDWIEANKAEIASRGIPYTSIAVLKWQRIKNKIGQCRMPVVSIKRVSDIYSNLRKGEVEIKNGYK